MYDFVIDVFTQEVASDSTKRVFVTQIRNVKSNISAKLGSNTPVHQMKSGNTMLSSKHERSTSRI